MEQSIIHLSLLVNDYDEAIQFYTKKLHFILVEDTVISSTKRWVVIAPQGSKSCSIVLAKASNDDQKNSVGNQTGGRVFLFLQTDNLQRDYENLLQNNITIIEPPTIKPHGTVVIFEDLYGNKWDLIQPSKK